jgi:hypothetical protein
MILESREFMIKALSSGEDLPSMPSHRGKKSTKGQNNTSKPFLQWHQSILQWRPLIIKATPLGLTSQKTVALRINFLTY